MPAIPSIPVNFWTNYGANAPGPFIGGYDDLGDPSPGRGPTPRSPWLVADPTAGSVLTDTEGTTDAVWDIGGGDFAVANGYWGPPSPAGGSDDLAVLRRGNVYDIARPISAASPLFVSLDFRLENGGDGAGFPTDTYLEFSLRNAVGSSLGAVAVALYIGSEPGLIRMSAGAGILETEEGGWNTVTEGQLGWLVTSDGLGGYEYEPYYNFGGGWTAFPGAAFTTTDDPRSVKVETRSDNYYFDPTYTGWTWTSIKNLTNTAESP